MAQSSLDYKSILDKLEAKSHSYRLESAFSDADGKCLDAYNNAIDVAKRTYLKSRTTADYKYVFALDASAQQYIASVKANPALRGKCPNIIKGSENFDAEKAAEELKAEYDRKHPH